MCTFVFQPSEEDKQVGSDCSIKALLVFGLEIQCPPPLEGFTGIQHVHLNPTKRTTKALPNGKNPSSLFLFVIILYRNYVISLIMSIV